MVLQSRAGIVKWDIFYYKVEHVLQNWQILKKGQAFQSRAIITKYIKQMRERWQDDKFWEPTP